MFANIFPTQKNTVRLIPMASGAMDGTNLYLTWKPTFLFDHSHKSRRLRTYVLCNCASYLLSLHLEFSEVCSWKMS